MSSRMRQQTWLYPPNSSWGWIGATFRESPLIVSLKRVKPSTDASARGEFISAISGPIFPPVTASTA